MRSLRDMGTPGVLMSGSKDEGAVLGSVKMESLPPGRGRLVHRRFAPTLIQTAKVTRERPGRGSMRSDSAQTTSRPGRSTCRGLVAVDGGVGGVVRHQPDVPVAALQCLDRGLAVDHRGDDVAVVGGGLLANHYPVAVGDGGVDHRVADHLEQEQRAVADEGLRQREQVLDHLLGQDIPFSSVGAAVVDFCCAFGLLLVMMLWYGVMPGPGILLVPVLFVFIGLMAAGVGTLLAALNVAYRDFQYVVPFMVQLWMFATPTIYMDPTANGSGTVRSAADCQSAESAGGRVSGGGAGRADSVGRSGGGGRGFGHLFFLGCLYFRRVEDSFSDII